jgi:glutamate-1-semialdehyde 2,1-aminomutase
MARMDQFAALERAELDAYLTRTPASRALYERARRVMPGGDTRTGTFHPPYPLFIARGEGPRVWDADGHVYLDLLNNFTSLVHGHAPPAVVAAITQQAQHGTAHGSANALQVELADTLCARVPSVERLRFCNSGTEATLGALRAAKAFTGKPRIMKMAGGYHGSHDQVAVGAAPPFDGPAAPGLSPGAVGEVVLGRFNDLPCTADLIRRHRHELAAVIVEPMLGSGAILAEREFLHGLREVTAECGVLLILDEIITFRLAAGGLQQVFELTPDLTTFGKIIGGGLPVGAFGGRADVMATYDPTRRGTISHSGTFNGNAATMAAGLATLALYDAGAVARLNATGDAFRARVNGIAQAAGVAAVVVGYGSVMQMHFRADAPRTPEAAAGASGRLVRLMHLALLNRGIFTAGRLLHVLSTPTTATALDGCAAAFSGVLALLAEAMAAGDGGPAPGTGVRATGDVLRVEKALEK